ncbi:MAG: glycosyltransferase family 2 protein [Acidobacteriota bacterium]
MSVKIAVVIPTYRRPDLLRRCLEALAKQVFPVDAYEVIVVDDGRDFQTKVVVESFNTRFNGSPTFRYLQPNGTRGPAGARNRGWRATQAPVIAFTDDDTEPAPEWLQEGNAAMHGEVAAVGGRLVVPTSAHPTDHERNTRGLEDAEFATANAFVWRHALVKVGGFDERFTRAWREDSDLQFTLMQQCGPVMWAPQAVVVHPVRKVPWGFSIRQQANVFFDALLYKKHPRLYRLKIKPDPPWLYYGIVGATLVALLCGLMGWGMAAALALILALLGALNFSFTRLRDADHTPSHVAEMICTSLVIPFLAVYWRIRGAIHFKVVFV